MNNIVIINGHSHDNVRNSLELWLSSYAGNQELDGSQFELYKKNETEFIIKADEKLPNEFFSYLVNYLTYPEGLEGRMNIIGYTLITDEKFFPKEFVGNTIMLFIPQDDTDYDNVYWVTKQNKVYKTDFGSKTVLVNPIRKFEEYDINISELEAPEVFECKYQEHHEPEIIETEEDRIKWIKFLAIATGIALLFSLVFYNQLYTSIRIVQIVGFALTCWFFADYKTLRTNKLYNYSLLIAVAVLLFGNLIPKSDAVLKYTEDMKFFTALPVLFLICQKIIRLTFIRTFKREPEIEKPVRSFADFLYIIFLIASTAFVCALIF